MVLQNISFDESDAVKNLYVVYRIRADDLIPQTVTAELGIHPTVAYQKGEKFIGKKYDPKAKKDIEVIRGHPFSVWDVNSESQQGLRRVTDHIMYLLDILEPHSEQIQRYLNQNEKYIISFYVRWEPHGEHGSYVIPGELLKRMGNLCHFVEFSFIGTFETD